MRGPLAERGDIPAEVIPQLRQRARLDIGRMQEIEAEVKHDVVAFVTAVAESVGPEGRYLHLGLTSSDVIDTGFAVQLCEATDVLLADLDALLAVLRRRAQEHQHTVMIGRSHGVHAEPITFGLKVAHWFAEMERNKARLEQARREVAVGKISGAVGTYANIDPAIETAVCARLGLVPETIATQVVPARPARLLFLDPGAGRQLARPGRDRAAPSATHRGLRGPGAVYARPEGLVGHAA